MQRVQGAISQEDQEWLEALETCLKSQLSNTGFSIAQLADEFSMSESTLLRRVKRLVGLSPMKYLQEIRLNEARQLLEQRKFNSISRVAYEIGFNDPKAFTRSFKKRFGKTPSAYL